MSHGTGPGASHGTSHGASHGKPGFDPDRGDVGPGVLELPERPENVREGVQGYLIGLALAAGLTVASFYVAGTHLIWGPGIPVALVVLAIAQIGIHLTFFLHITTAPDNTNNIMALAFGVLIVFLVVGGSIWIMQHMNANMMPTPQLMMHMQR